MQLTLFLSLLFTLSSSVVKLIIDTDMGFDVDDVGAVCAAHAMADKGEVEIIAIVHDAGYPRGIGAVSVLNHYYGRDHIPLGAFKGSFGADTPGVYIDDLVDNWESPVKHYDQVKDAVEVLREALASAEDHSVVISSVGFLTNIGNLLSSPGDMISNKTGYELVRDKVGTKHEIVFLGQPFLTQYHYQVCPGSFSFPALFTTTLLHVDPQHYSTLVYVLMSPQQ